MTGFFQWLNLQFSMGNEVCLSILVFVLILFGKKRKELHAGALMSANPDHELRKVETLLDHLTVVYPDVSFPVMYGDTEAQLRKIGNKVPVMDLLIGVTAKSFGMPLLTKDVKHFKSIPGLVVESY